MKRTVLVLAVLAGAGYAVSRWQDNPSPPSPTTHDSKLALGRLWVDHVPRHERDLFQIFALFTRDPIGVFQVRSAWTGTYEGFRYELHGHELRAVYPQNGDREKIQIEARRCNEGRMQYCLDIEGASRGVKRYYSRDGWELPPNATHEQIDELAARALSSMP